MGDIEQLLITGNINDINNAINSGVLNINESLNNADEDYPIHIAARNNNYQLVKLLIDRGASTKVRNEDYDTPLKLTTNLDILDLIINSPEYGGIPPINELTVILSNAQKRRDKKLVQDLIDKYPNITASGSDFIKRLDLVDDNITRDLINNPQLILSKLNDLSEKQIVDYLSKVIPSTVSNDLLKLVLNTLSEPQILIFLKKNPHYINHVIDLYNNISLEFILLIILLRKLDYLLLKRPDLIDNNYYNIVTPLYYRFINDIKDQDNNLVYFLSTYYNNYISVDLANILHFYNFNIDTMYYTFFLQNNSIAIECEHLNNLVIPIESHYKYINSNNQNELLLDIWSRAAIEINAFYRNQDMSTLNSLNEVLSQYTDYMDLPNAYNYVTNYLSQLNNLIQRAPKTQFESMVFRGVGSDYPKPNVGDIIPINIISTTQDYNTAKMFSNNNGYLFRIYIPKNHPVLSVGFITGGFNKSDWNEILIGNGNMRITNVNGNNIIAQII